MELSKTILFSNNKKLKKEIKEVSAYIFKQILILMHPFIPFITEEIWLKNKFDNSNKNFLMYTNWLSKKIKKDKKVDDVEKIIIIITTIRSFKNELNINPGSFIDLSLEKIKNKDKIFFKKNGTMLKKLGRINNFLLKDKKSPSATIIIKGDLFKIYFDQNVDLNLIKENLSKKKNKYQDEMKKISLRLKNKAFIEKAPKNIVDQEKNNYNNLNKDINKISSIIESL